MDRVECSNSAYEKLNYIGILERMRKVKEDLTKIFLYRTIWEGRANEILESARKVKTPDEEQQDILSLETKLEGDELCMRVNPFVIEHPYLVAKVVLEEDLEKFSEFGFSSKKNLAKAINAYYIGEKEVITKASDNYIWRRGDFKNNVRLNEHGDLSVIQTDVTGGDDSGVLVNPISSGFGLQQDWSPFLYSVLMYAKASFGKRDILEITDWENQVEEIRTSNPHGHNLGDFKKRDSTIESIFIRSLSGTQPEISLKTWINDYVLPHYFGDGTLDILRLDKEGKLKVCLYNKLENVDVVAHYVQEDIPDLLKANYKLYARSLEDLAKIMYKFNKEVNKKVD